jgi:hypothetical protein
MAAARELVIADEPAALKDSNPIRPPIARSTNRKPSGSFDRDMSVRYDLRLQTLPAIAGKASFSRVERMFATPNAPRT